MKYKSLVRQRFGKLVVLSLSHMDKRYGAYFVCICDCGNTHIAASSRLQNGDTKSCGCLQPEIMRKRLFKHGAALPGKRTLLYLVWAGMIARCEDKYHKSYKNYGGRGITVCPEWRRDFTAFRDWALSHGYAVGLTIDRKDNDGNYEPGNCQWLTRSENSKKKIANSKAKRDSCIGSGDLSFDVEKAR